MQCAVYAGARVASAQGHFDRAVGGERQPDAFAALAVHDQRAAAFGRGGDAQAPGVFAVRVDRNPVPERPADPCAVDEQPCGVEYVGLDPLGRLIARTRRFAQGDISERSRAGTQLHARLSTCGTSVTFHVVVTPARSSSIVDAWPTVALLAMISTDPAGRLSRRKVPSAAVLPEEDSKSRRLPTANPAAPIA